MIAITLYQGDCIRRTEVDQLPEELLRLFRLQDSCKEVQKLELTPRQTEILHRVGQGLPDKQIASDLRISISTVRFHLKAAMRTMNAQNRTEAALKATGRNSSLEGLSVTLVETA